MEQVLVTCSSSVRIRMAQSADSYLSAADCGVNDPTPTQDIGFPNMMIVFNVDGNCPAV